MVTSVGVGTTAEVSRLAHLMRRAGFGASYDELEQYATWGYDATVDWLLNPEREPEVDDEVTLRFSPEQVDPQGYAIPTGRWIYRMLNTRRPLEEKMALFWHHVFATGFSKLNYGLALWKQYETFRRYGLGNLRELLVQVSKDPAMIYWLDNCDNHREAPNENYGRELLELFSMGIGTYAEDDVKACARAFTGWTYKDPLPRFPYGFYYSGFEYRPEDHDSSAKTFLGHEGRFNGEDVIDIIVKQPATAVFIARHLYNFFVADEAQVPAWPYTPPRDSEAVQTLAHAYMNSGYEMRPVLETLFKSEFFDKARFARVKSPIELTVGVVRLTGDYSVALGTFPKFGLADLATQTGNMGQQVFNPPSVEGWHTGSEWINSGTLVARGNFAASRVGNPRNPGVRLIIDRLAARTPLPPEAFVDGCLELMGTLRLHSDTREALIAHAEQQGHLDQAGPEDHASFQSRVVEMLQLIVAMPEYQFE